MTNPLERRPGDAREITTHVRWHARQRRPFREVWRDCLTWWPWLARRRGAIQAVVDIYWEAHPLQKD